jgi:UDP-3-O-[3-hydroxymyristoyl] glucosamine N-acyltransferase
MTPLRLSELCNVLEGVGLPARLEGEDRLIRAVNTLEDASDQEISFLSNPKYQDALATTAASAVILTQDVTLPDRLAAIRCPDPYAALTVAIVQLHGYRRHPHWGVSDRASIDPSAKIGENANIAGGATVAGGVTIGNNCTLYPGCYVGEGVQVGHDCTLYPNVVIYERCILGDRVTIHAGSVIGEDGLGYVPKEDKWVKIPQVGHAVIGDDVEIGANCTIDRATLGKTEIGPGTKFGNVVVIGHGTKVGPDCMFVGHVGVAGSVTVGRHVTLAGQVGVAGHLSIGDDTRVAGQSGVSGDVKPESDLFGSPAIPLTQAKRAIFVFQKLPQWSRRIRDLEREVRELREKLSPETSGFQEAKKSD